MATKSAEQKAIEKRMREEKRHALEAARRERAKAVVNAAQYIDSFCIMNAEAEELLKVALNELKDPSAYVASVEKTAFESNIYDDFALVCEELQMYGMVTSYMMVGSFARITLSEAGKTYFAEKEVAQGKAKQGAEKGRNSIFISHRGVDATVADMIKDFLVSTGIPNDKVFCSSLPGNDVHEKIGSEVRHRLRESAINVLILSKDYYESAYCLNEAGVAWYLEEAVAIPFGLPEINHEDMIGFFDSDYKLRRLDNDGDISYLYDNAKERLHVPDVKHSVITREIQKLRERYAQYLLARNVDPETMEEQVTQETTTVELRKDICILLVYAAADKNGQILVTNGITRTAPAFSTHGFEFTVEDSARESARWKAAVEQLERLGLIEAENYERTIFTVTDQGFKVADLAVEKWSIDTGKMPDEYLDK